MLFAHHARCWLAVAATPLLLLLLNLTNLRQMVLAQPDNNICLVMYLMADNDLEDSITDDLFELYESPAIIQPNLITWIYYDSHGSMLDYDGDGTTDHPIPDISLPHYFHFDHEIQDLVEDTVLPNEVNSDDPKVLCDFLTLALEDCVSKGADEYILTFSSHGGGHHGFGGDENTERQRRRKLDHIQPNSDIVSAIKCGLDSVVGAPAEFDVIGFGK